jgi:predicted peptidase
MHRTKSWVAALLFAALASKVPDANVADFADFSLKSGASTILPGRLYVPPEASLPGAERPFILFLHGAGEAGTNNSAQVNGNIDNLLAAAKLRGAYLYAPQSTGAWSSTTLTSNVMTMINRALGEQHVDADRLYVTGLSNGGGGTWNMLNRYPDAFAAAIPICGVAPASDFVASRLVNEPIAAFHARNDPTVSVATSRNVLNNILTQAHESLPAYPSTRDTTTTFVFSAASHDLNYVEFPTGGHGIWPVVYGTPEVYDWLFAHTLAVPEPSAMLIAAVAMIGLIHSRRRTQRKPMVVQRTGPR